MMKDSIQCILSPSYNFNDEFITTKICPSTVSVPTSVPVPVDEDITDYVIKDTYQRIFNHINQVPVKP